MRVNMISLSPKRASVRTILWLVFSIALLSNMAGIPFTTSIVYASSMDTPQLLSDVNDDGVVDIGDVIEVGKAYGSEPGHLNWNPRADVNDDGFVDILDLVRVATDRIADAHIDVERFWSDDSYWNKKIPVNAPLHPNSAQMVNWLVNEDGHFGGHPTPNENAWTKPIWDAYKDTRKVTVHKASGSVLFYNVPIASGWEPASDGDHSMGIIDWYNRKYYDFWHMYHNGDYWWADAGYIYDLDGSGIMPKGQWSVGGSSTPFLAGAIRDEEIVAGIINHPLMCCLATPKRNYHVYPPAATTDGKDTSTYAIPEGARIQLNPDWNLDSLGLTRTQKIILKAMQEYGIVVKESGGAWALYFEHELSIDGVWRDYDVYSFMFDIPGIESQWRIVDYSVFGGTKYYLNY
jgi:hypothetical protein